MFLQANYHWIITRLNEMKRLAENMGELYCHDDNEDQAWESLSERLCKKAVEFDLW